jgi:hypothetical protein
MLSTISKAKYRIGTDAEMITFYWSQKHNRHFQPMYLEQSALKWDHLSADKLAYFQ